MISPVIFEAQKGRPHLGNAETNDILLLLTLELNKVQSQHKRVNREILPAIQQFFSNLLFDVEIFNFFILKGNLIDHLKKSMKPVFIKN